MTRILAALSVLAFCACGGAQHSTREASVVHVTGAMTDRGGAQLWRFSFDVSKDWTPETHPPARQLGLLNADHDATLLLVLDASAQDDSAMIVAERYVQKAMDDIGLDPLPPDSPEMEQAMKKGRGDALYTGDGDGMAIQCHVHAVTVSGHSVWMVMLGVGPSATALQIAHDLYLAADTAKFEPIDW